LEFINFKPGDFCAVKVYRTQQWWRGEIIGDVNHETIGDAVRVRLVDKGRNTIVAKQNIKQLASCFNQVPMLSVAVRLADMKYAAPFTENARAAIKKFFEESCITMNVVRTPIDNTSPYAVNLYNKRQVSLSHILSTVCLEFPSDGTHGENIKDLEKAFTLTSVPSWKPQFDVEYEGIVTNKAEKKVYWMSNHGKDCLRKVTQMLQMNDLEQATEIHVDECYVMMIRNFPGRVKVTENGDFISVINIDTGVTVSHVDQQSLYYLPTELTKYQAAAIALRMNTIDFNLPKGSLIKINISGWNQTYEAYDAEFIRQVAVQDNMSLEDNVTKSQMVNSISISSMD